MLLTADFIRALTGLSPAELSDETIAVLNVIAIAQDKATAYPDLSADESLYYQGYKAITLLGPSLLLSVPTSVKDNFNSFTRDNLVKDLLELAISKVAEVELLDSDSLSMIDIIPPNIDPITQESR